MPEKAIRSNENWEEILARQEHPALIIGADRRVLAVSSSFRDRVAGSGDPTGRMCHQVLHGSRPPCSGSGGRCPLKVATRDGDSMVHRHQTRSGPVYERVSTRRLGRNGDSVVLVVNRPLELGPGSWSLRGRSLAVLRLLDRMAQTAAEDGVVLIRGEPGTGRAGIARLVHDLSVRSAGPFVPADCSAVDSWRLEAVLFGRPKAVGERSSADRGLYAAAAGGTLFLREPHLLPPSLQRHIGLLLDTGESTCRWIFSVDQSAASPHGALQPVLTAAVPLLVPPLRDRAEDLPMLLDTLSRRFGGSRPPAIEPEVRKLLAAYPFPGNLRELECMVERACLFAGSGPVGTEHFSQRVRRFAAVHGSH